AQAQGLHAPEGHLPRTRTYYHVTFVTPQASRRTSLRPRRAQLTSAAGPLALLDHLVGGGVQGRRSVRYHEQQQRRSSRANAVTFPPVAPLAHPIEWTAAPRHGGRRSATRPARLFRMRIASLRRNASTISPMPD